MTYSVAVTLNYDMSQEEASGSYLTPELSVLYHYTRFLRSRHNDWRLESYAYLYTTLGYK